jgi:hypothetical protein
LIGMRGSWQSRLSQSNFTRFSTPINYSFVKVSGR